MGLMVSLITIFHLPIRKNNWLFVRWSGYVDIIGSNCGHCAEDKDGSRAATLHTGFGFGAAVGDG